MNSIGKGIKNVDGEWLTGHMTGIGSLSLPLRVSWYCHICSYRFEVIDESKMYPGFFILLSAAFSHASTHGR